ncbi:MAG: HAMP domain-containing protein [Rubrobacteridae bacterium]|nr:HAMP domain-containing protein [Rubrobacteridae bacterium]
MQFSFRTRLVVLYTILTSFALICFSATIFFAVRYQSYAKLEQDLIVRASHVNEQIDFEKDTLVLPPSMTRDSVLEIRYDVLIDEKRNSFFKSSVLGSREVLIDDLDLETIDYSPKLIDARLTDGTPIKSAIIRAKHIPGKSYFITAKPVAEVEAGMESLGITMAIGNVLFILLVFGIGSFFVQRALKPVRDITELAKDISRGDLSKRVNFSGPLDDLKALADMFDEMITKLEELFEGQKSFFQEVSHDLRTPLTIIRGKIDVALRSNNVTHSELVTVLNEVRNEAELATGLVNDLLAVARGEKAVEELKQAEFPLDRMVVEIGARITSLGKQKGDSLIIKLSVSDAFAVTTIRDTGPGISKEDQPFVFEKFYRSQSCDHSSRGFGLGLAIAKRIVEAHKASLKLVSSDKHGTEFEIRLPLLNR